MAVNAEAATMTTTDTSATHTSFFILNMSDKRPSNVVVGAISFQDVELVFRVACRVRFPYIGGGFICIR